MAKLKRLEKNLDKTKVGDGGRRKSGRGSSCCSRFQDTAAVLEAVDTILSAINISELAAAFGQLTDKDDNEEQEGMQTHNMNKKILIDALRAKVVALTRDANGEAADAAARDKIKEALAQLAKWTDVEELEVRLGAAVGSEVENAEVTFYST